MTPDLHSHDRTDETPTPGPRAATNEPIRTLDAAPSAVREVEEPRRGHEVGGHEK
jgi:hypothetical protein